MAAFRTIDWPTGAHPFFKLDSTGRDGIDDLLLERDRNGPFQSDLNGTVIIVGADATKESLGNLFVEFFRDKRKHDG